jgi:DNA-binding NarL/FixJ family response regulator
VTRPARSAARPDLRRESARWVLRLVAKGLTAKRVAERLTLSHRTVENHVRNALEQGLD